MPYGEESVTSPNDQMKFATYTRDSSTGLDYADQRFYTSQFGRFMSADRFNRAPKVNDSGSWNKYSYTSGDPVNRVDRQGTEDYCTDEYCCEDGDDCDGDPCDEDPSLCGGGGGAPPPKKPKQPKKKAAVDPCDRSNAKNATYLNFIDAHRDDAQATANSSGIGLAEILGVSAAESFFGTSRLAQDDDNFFGIHNPGTPFPGQTGVEQGTARNKRRQLGRNFCKLCGICERFCNYRKRSCGSQPYRLRDVYSRPWLRHRYGELCC